jgi:hypothetical protein
MQFKFMTGDVDYLTYGGTFYSPVQVVYDDILRDAVLFLQVYGHDNLPEDMRKDYVSKQRKREKIDTGKHRTSLQAPIHAIELSYVSIGDMSDDFILNALKGYEDAVLSLLTERPARIAPQHIIAEILSSQGCHAHLANAVETNYARARKMCTDVAKDFVQRNAAQGMLDQFGNRIGDSKHSMMLGRLLTWGIKLPDQAAYRPPQEVVASVLRKLQK